MSTSCKVFVDGEDVVFSGAVPENVAAFTNIVFGLIEQNNRYVISFTVDSESVHESMLEKPLDAFKEIRIETAPQRDFFIKLVDQQVQSFEKLRGTPENTFLPLLSKPYSETCGQFDYFFVGIAPLLEALQSVQDYSVKHEVKWKAQIGDIQSRVNRSLDCFLAAAQNADLGLLAEIVGYDLVPALVNVLDFFKKDVKPYFESFAV